VLDEYVKNGGKVLVVNSANRLKFYNRVLDENEDWPDLNTLTSRWGVNFTSIGADLGLLDTVDRGLVEGIPIIKLTPENAVAFTVDSGDVLAGENGRAYLAHLEIGAGEVVVISDLTMLGDYSDNLLNPQLVQNLAAWE
jgi:hypothetical protein